MDPNKFSDEAKTFLQHVLGTGEKWLAEEIKKMYESATDEKDFLEETVLYLTRLDIKIKTLKKVCEKLTGISSD